METGIYSDEYVEILDGLSEGEEIVATYTATSSKSASSDGSKKKGMGGPPPM